MFRVMKVSGPLNPSEKKALEAEFLRAAKSEWQKVQVRRKKMEKGRSKAQREISGIESRASELRRRYMVDPTLREIDRKYRERMKIEDFVQLHCPECGDSDKGNRMNGKPWCFKCNVMLVPKGKVSKWFKGTVKVVKKSLRDDLRRLNPGLHPEESK